MILKVDRVSGLSFYRLLGFVHSQENRLGIEDGPQPMVVQLKSVEPNNRNAGGKYGADYDIALEILDRIPTPISSSDPNEPVDPKYLLRVYQIITKDIT